MLLYELSGCRFESCCSHLNVRFSDCFEQAVAWLSGNYRVSIRSKTRTWHNKNIQWRAPNTLLLTTQLYHLASLTKWLSVRLRTKWLWVWNYCSYLNFSFHVCFEQRVPLYSGNYRAWILPEMRRWHDKNIQSNTPYILVHPTQLNHLVLLAKRLSVGLRTKWLWIRVSLHSLKRQISRLFRGRSSLTLSQL